MTLGSLVSGARLAMDTIRAHKMRSFLTVLGVIIGTGAVIGVGSIIAGLDGAITGLLRSFGPNTVIVTKTSAAVQALTSTESYPTPKRAITNRSSALDTLSAVTKGVNTSTPWAPST